MSQTTTPSASDSGLNLDHLEALARKTLNSKSISGAMRNMGDFREAATPAAVLELIALARRAAPVSAPIAGEALRADIDRLLSRGGQ